MRKKNNYALDESPLILNCYNVTGHCGNSGSCALASMLVSIALQKPIRFNTVMTGILNLDGSISRIGGLKYKIQAAITHDFKYFLAPMGHKENVEELDRKRGILKSISVVFVKNFEEVYDFLFESN